MMPVDQYERLRGAAWERLSQTLFPVRPLALVRDGVERMLCIMPLFHGYNVFLREIGEILRRNPGVSEAATETPGRTCRTKNIMAIPA